MSQQTIFPTVPEATAKPRAKEHDPTPLMRQYTAAKQQHPDALLLFRLGDFYELFFDDAVVASRELQLTLTSRDKERAVPMCGVPYHAAENYIARLLRNGHRVALCEQMEEAGPGKKLVRREVTRVLSPGTAFDPALEGAQSNFLAAVSKMGESYGLAWLDLTTGDFMATEFAGPDAAGQCAEELQRLPPKELLFPAGASLFSGVQAGAQPGAAAPLTRTAVEDWAWSPDYAVPLLLRTLGAASLDGYGLAEKIAAAAAAGATLHYVKATQPGGCEHIRGIRAYQRSENLQLDSVTIRNLELIEPTAGSSNKATTLFATLDACQTAMGKRLLKTNILRPALDAQRINQRLDAVAEAKNDLVRRETLRELLSEILDIERLLARIALESAGPRDLLALGRSLAIVPRVREQLEGWHAGAWPGITAGAHTHAELCHRLLSALVENPPALWAEGGFIAAGVDAELDELRALGQTSRQTIAAMEERERRRTGIGSLKVRFNSVFGYYIEITKANLHAVPADYDRKQTLVNAERFTTPELKEYETKVLTAQERAISIEKRLFAELRRAVLDQAPAIRATSSAIAEADLLASFAHLAAVRNYSRPQLCENACIQATGARHPVLEQIVAAQGGRYVANDVFVDSGAQAILLITGPNMGGKSTYLRQAALLVIMAQMGSFVSAGSMQWGLVDQIFTRIGAADDAGRGRSTFMVEMTETANILNTATANSLVLLDEMGRGTATFDGLSLAWATLEYLHANVRARTLFATHYHELTLLAEQLPGLQNLHVTCRESANGIVFLHHMEPGPASKSYGIEVARLAGLPATVVERARAVLRQHEASEKNNVAAETQASAMQMTIFTPLSQRIVDRLQAADLNGLTPLQALNLLEELQRELRSGEAAP